MTLERLEGIMRKQIDIVNQIRKIKEDSEAGKDIQIIGDVPEGITAQDLINFQRDRYSILEVAKNYDNKRLIQWLNQAKNRKPQDFKTVAEIALLEGIIND